jgi:hypothetical protein
MPREEVVPLALERTAPEDQLLAPKNLVGNASGCLFTGRGGPCGYNGIATLSDAGYCHGASSLFRP